MKTTDKCIPDQFYTPEERARFFDAVGKRRSIRAYAGAPDKEQMARLQRFVAETALPGVRIVLTDCDDSLFTSYPVVGAVMGCRRVAVIIYDQAQMYSKLYAGLAGESLVLEATSMGLGTCWVAGSWRRNKLQCVMQKTEKIAALITIGIAAEKIETPRKRKKLADICHGDPSSWPMWAFNAAECVRCAPSAMNMQPWRLAYAGNTLVLLRSWWADDLDMGIALLHMSIGLREIRHTLTFGEKQEVARLFAEE